MKYLFIAKKFVNLKRGAWTASEDLSKKFPQSIDIIEDTKVSSLDDVAVSYDKVVLVTQVPHLYAFPVNFLSLHRNDHLIYIRSEHNLPYYNSCTNGFYYYSEHEDIKHYIPFIPNLKPTKITEERYGFYYRPYLNPDACQWFVDNFKDNDIPIMTMGVLPKPFIKRKNWKHTYNRNEFWSSISSYFYPISTKYIDPFPTSVVEAMQTGKVVIFPSLGVRNYKDGIDDCIEVYRYGKDLFNFNNFVSYYNSVISNGMNNTIDRIKYNNIVSYILSII